MVKINNKGLSVVELIVSFVLCILVFVFIIQVVSSVEELYLNLGIKTELLNKQSLISEKLNNKFSNNKTILIKKCSSDCLTFFYKDNTFEKMQINRIENTLSFGDDVFSFDGLGNVDDLSVTLLSGGLYNKSILTININVKNSIFDTGKYIIKALYQYNNNETIYSPSTSEKAEIFLLGPAVSYKFSDDLFIEPGWMVYYPSGKITINESDVTASPMDFDSDGNGFIKYNGNGEAAGVEKTRVIKTYETAKERVLALHKKATNNEVYTVEGTGKYVFKGANSNNYLKLGNERLFRIIALEVQTKYVTDENGHVVVENGVKQTEEKYLLKVVSEDYVTNESGESLLRFEDAPWWSPLSGISAWTKKTCDALNPDNCNLEIQYINNIVNGVYLNNLLNTSASSQIKNGTFNVGMIPWENSTYSHFSVPVTQGSGEVYTFSAKTLYDLESADVVDGLGNVDPGKWSGNCLDDVCGPNAGIISFTDVVFASADPNCLDTVRIADGSGVSCVLNNWLWKFKTNESQEGEYFRMMTRNTLQTTWLLSELNYLGTNDLAVPLRTRATLYLDADLYISGSGTFDNPYTLYSMKK